MNDKLPADLAQLFAAERDAPGAPPGARGRVEARLAASLVAPVAHAATGKVVLAKLGAGKLLMGVALLAGVGSGAAVLSSRRAPPPPAAAPSAAKPAPAPVPVPTVAPLELPPVAPPSAVLPELPRRPRPASADTLAEEQRLLDPALAALERRDAGAALAAVGAHLQHYPTGVLAEEREVLAVRALVVAGRGDAARARADRFRRRFPDSIQLDVIAEALAQIPVTDPDGGPQ